MLVLLLDNQETKAITKTKTYFSKCVQPTKINIATKWIEPDITKDFSLKLQQRILISIILTSEYSS